MKIRPLTIAIIIILCVSVAPLTSSSEEPRHLAIKKMAQKIANQIEQKEKLLKVGVVPFKALSGKRCLFDNYLSEILTTEMFNTGCCGIIEKKLMDKMLVELKLSETGILDPSTTKKLGKILGVDALLTGTTVDLGRTVEINCRLIKVDTGAVLSASSVEIKKDPAIIQMLRECQGQVLRIPRGNRSRKKLVDGSRYEMSIKKILHYGGDWPIIVLENFTVLQEQIMELHFSVQNNLSSGVVLSLDEPSTNVYMVNEQGYACNFLSVKGMDRQFSLNLRSGESKKFSISLRINNKVNFHEKLKLYMSFNARGYDLTYNQKKFIVRLN